ncbi:hypothetical protein BH11BAC2_BH11BAC2_23560 [soil metagenome]
MINRYFRSVLLLCSFMFLFQACKKEEESAPQGYQTGSVSLDFANMVGTEVLDVTGSTSYMNAADDPFTVTEFRYYLSNFELLKSDGSSFVIPDSYFLIKAGDPASLKRILKDVPGGVYTGVKFMIGIDSTHNVSGAQNGDLDPINGMIWNWNTGYIFVKLEGQSVNSPTGSYQYHISGFSDYSPVNGNAIRYVNMNFNSDSLIVDGTRTAKVFLTTNLLDFFTDPDNLSIASTNSIMTTGLAAVRASNRYQDMITYDHLINPEN